MAERLALVFDREGGPLAELSLALVPIGLAPIYARELDEVVLLAREYGPRIGAILSPADAVRERLPALLERIVQPLGLRPSAVVPVGLRLGLEEADALAKRGVRWALWRPFDEADLRFVVARALSESDVEELRLHARVPCRLPAQLESPLRKARALLTDLSPGGCFARLDEPFPSGARTRVRCALSGGSVAIGGRVAWVSGPGTPAWHAGGVGIEFLEMPDDARALVTRTVDQRLARYRV